MARALSAADAQLGDAARGQCNEELVVSNRAGRPKAASGRKRKSGREMANAADDKRIHEVLVLVGAGGIGLAIARRLGAGRGTCFAGINEERLQSDVVSLEADGTASTPNESMWRYVSPCVRSRRRRWSWAASSRSSTLPACHRYRHHQKRSWPSTSSTSRQRRSHGASTEHT